MNLLITTDLEGRFSSLIDELKANGHALFGASLIQFTPLSFDPNLPNADWLFFSSRRAVQFFYDQIRDIPKRKIGAIGPGTADELTARGIACDFIGTSTDTSEVAVDFQSTIGLDKVIFPTAKSGRRVIQSALKTEQSFDIPCYSSEPKKTDLSEVDLILFTSPSNVTSFVQQYSWRPKFSIAIGPSTAEKMEALDIDFQDVLKKFTEDDVRKTIFSLIRS